ncbi:MAG: outer membrane lipid asymmetry maintenance protein MlaD [Desulfobaccales bacterium]|jgi:phospholipid/cholesterol/gamma-HCH transport system substrate-binding protein
MRRGNLELAVGGFVLLGLLCLTYLAIHLGKMEVWGSGYRVVANFDNVSGLAQGGSVEVAGVRVGRVETIRLTPGDQAAVTLSLKPGLQLHDDAIASIRTRGIIGDKFVQLSPGNSEKLISAGGTIHDTESGIDLEELISTFIHGKV